MGDIFLRAVLVFAYDEAVTMPEKGKTLDRLERFIQEQEILLDADWVICVRSHILATKPLTNGQVTILLAPSGSKIGWDTDDAWLKLRDAFVSFARDLPFANVLEINDRYDAYPRWVITTEGDTT